MFDNPSHGLTDEQVALADEIDATKYRQPGETFEDKVRRLALALSDDFGHEKKLLQILGEQRFLPAGRVQAAVGAKREVTPYNCFVSAVVEDNFDSIMLRASEAGKTMRLGGGIGYDFSRLRPRGDAIKSIESKASGPVSFMEVYDAICKTVASAGHRRGAQMGVLRIDHPDVEEFIRVKRQLGKLEAFNISLAVTDKFMAAVEHDREFDLTFEGKVYRTISARTLWDEIMMSNWDWAEPGVLFIDRINDMNNLKGREKIEATNPCAEQPLPPNGACLLGSFNMTAYLTADLMFDWQKFVADIPAVVRGMDNVIDQALYPLTSQEVEAKQKRRMGLGVTGMANALEMMGLPYGSEKYIWMQSRILQELAVVAYQSSIDLAKEKGPYPMWLGEQHTAGFLRRKIGPYLGPKYGALLELHGIRNSHLTSIAPTGTISITAGNISSGIEPTFSRSQKRKINMPDGERIVDLQDYAFAKGHKVTTADEVPADVHVKVLCAAQEWVDSAVSKTCNVGDSVTYEQFKDLYLQAYRGGAKGCTTFRPAGKRYGILTSGDHETPTVEDDEVAVAEACYIDPMSGQRECS